MWGWQGTIDDMTTPTTCICHEPTPIGDAAADAVTVDLFLAEL